MQDNDMQGKDDLLHLNDFSEDSVLHNVKKRFQEQGNTFTQIGAPILISINPYKRLPIFNIGFAQKVRDYSAQVRGLGGNSRQLGQQPVENPGPHLFMVAEDTFQSLINDQKNQSIIITGDSGAGKTEACKIILAYIARANEAVFEGSPEQDLHTPGAQQKADSTKMESVETYVLDSNPLLEAFGNAKTTRNTNSSRFGKFIQMGIQTQSGNICKAKILSYLLEKSRTTSVADHERSFHIFYQALATPEIRSQFQLPSANPADYGFLKSKTETYSIAGVDDGANYNLTLACMRSIGFTEDEITQIWQILAAILHLGNVNYAENQDDDAMIEAGCKAMALKAAELLCFQDPERMVSILEKKVVKYPGQVITTNFNLNEAISARNSCAKTIYGKLFNWIVQKINNSIESKISLGQADGMSEANVHSLGILDIFGFESFQKNSFEQLTINYANEKLQQHFNQHMIALEMNEYRYELGEEAVANIHFEDSSRCLELFESVNVAAPSLFKLIDEEGSIRGNDENLLRKFHQFHLAANSNPHYKKASKMDTPQFMITHYAGDVIYDVAGFTEKNKDFLSEHIVETLSATTHPLMQILFPQTQASAKVAPRRGKIAGVSLSNQFVEQLSALINTINESVPRYVRCIKPNSKASSDPADLEDEPVKEQLRAGSILEAVRIRKIGYGYRMQYDDFVDQFWPIMGGRIYEADKAAIEQVFLRAADLTDDEQTKSLISPGPQQGWQCGVTKLFIKDEVRFAMESALNRCRSDKATLVQAAMRRKIAKRLFRERLNARSTIQRMIMAYVTRMRWKNLIMKNAEKFLAIVVRIQQRFRFKRRREGIMNYFRVRKQATIKIQRAFRRQWAYEKLVKNLNRRHEARIKLQKAFRWRYLMRSVVTEVMRRAKRQREIQKELLASVANEQKEVNVLRAANTRMQQSLIEKDERIKHLDNSQRNMVEDAVQRQMLDSLMKEITQLKEHVGILEKRLSIQSDAESHGYF